MSEPGHACVARELAVTLTHLTRTMRAAVIEDQQAGSNAAMQWILNALPDQWDGPPELQWDGKESAEQWLERVDAVPEAGALEASPDGAVALVREYERWRDASPGERLSPVTGPEVQIDPYAWMARAAEVLSQFLGAEVGP